jgi:hypothetical protein
MEMLRLLDPGARVDFRPYQGEAKNKSTFPGETCKRLLTQRAPHLSDSAGFGTLIEQVAVVSSGRSLRHS